jgi:hypothetical protein
MKTTAPRWLAADLDLLTTDLAQLRLHLGWLMEDLGLAPLVAPEHDAAARRLGRDLERSEERLAELTRTLGEAGRVW